MQQEHIKEINISEKIVMELMNNLNDYQKQWFTKQSLSWITFKDYNKGKNILSTEKKPLQD